MKKAFSLILMTICCTIVMTCAVPALAGTNLAERVLPEINLARTDPRAYAGFIRNFRRQYQGTSYRLPGSHDVIMTAEGTRAVDEAISFLSRQQPLPALAWSEGLAAAAADLVRDEGESGAVGHRGGRSGNPRERIGRHGTWWGSIAENIGYGPDEARLVVMQLIIDDGVPDRGHRKNFFNRDFRKAGVACGTHPGYGNMCVVDFAGGFREWRVKKDGT
jgi:uncharacterized protein YkwD